MNRGFVTRQVKQRFVESCRQGPAHREKSAEETIDDGLPEALDA